VSAHPLRALALANARYWPTVAPVVRRELAAWRAPARAIADPVLRSLALAKLEHERFNAEVAATLATLAPAAARPRAARAIVAYELLFDYLDGRTELPCEDPVGEGERLFGPFAGALAVDAGRREPSGAGASRDADGAYMRALAERTRAGLFSLPGAAGVAGCAGASAERCAQAQVRLHAARSLGVAQLREWATERSRDSGLGWREYLGGCASSVLAVHALIAAAADEHAGPQDAGRLDAAYLAIGGVITMLDSLVDRRGDAARGEAGFIELFRTRAELASSLRWLSREALARAWEAPNGDHHAMTLAGVVAYYTTHPGARDTGAREIVAEVRRELSPTVWPALAVMRVWRAAKRVRLALASSGPNMLVR